MKIVRIERGAPAPCELCGTIAELRPYGPEGQAICHECGHKDWKQTVRKHLEICHDADILIIDGEIEYEKDHSNLGRG